MNEGKSVDIWKIINAASKIAIALVIAILAWVENQSISRVQTQQNETGMEPKIVEIV